MATSRGCVPASQGRLFQRFLRPRPERHELDFAYRPSMVPCERDFSCSSVSTTRGTDQTTRTTVGGFQRVGVAGSQTSVSCRHASLDPYIRSLSGHRGHIKDIKKCRATIGLTMSGGHCSRHPYKNPCPLYPRLASDAQQLLTIIQTERHTWSVVLYIDMA